MGKPEEGCLHTLGHSIAILLRPAAGRGLACARWVLSCLVVSFPLHLAYSDLPFWLCAGGDASLSVCLWRAGYAFTDPGYSFYHPEVQAFDPGAEAGADLLSGLGQLNRKDYTTCGSTCVVRLPVKTVRQAVQDSPAAGGLAAAGGRVAADCPQRLCCGAPHQLNGIGQHLRQHLHGEKFMSTAQES